MELAVGRRISLRNISVTLIDPLADGVLSAIAWSQMGGSEDEAFPLGPDTFFYKDDLGSAEFTRDAQGNVTGYTYHRVDGQEIYVKRVK